MKIYFVSSGSYSDFSVEGMFSTREKAQEYIDLFPKNTSDFNDIEEMEVDEYLGKHKTWVRVVLYSQSPKYVERSKAGSESLPRSVFTPVVPTRWYQNTWQVEAFGWTEEEAVEAAKNELSLRGLTYENKT